MKTTVLLLVAAFLLASFAVFLRGKLKDGEQKNRAGRQKLAKYDNWFVEIFFSLTSFMPVNGSYLKVKRNCRSGR